MKDNLREQYILVAAVEVILVGSVGSLGRRHTKHRAASYRPVLDSNYVTGLVQILFGSCARSHNRLSRQPTIIITGE